MKAQLHQTKTEEEIPATPPSGCTSQPQKNDLVLTWFHLTRFYPPFLQHLHPSSKCSVCASCSQPLSIKQGLELTSNGHHTFPADPTTGTHLPKKGGQKSDTCNSQLDQKLVLLKINQFLKQIWAFQMSIFKIKHLAFNTPKKWIFNTEKWHFKCHF